MNGQLAIYFGVISLLIFSGWIAHYADANLCCRPPASWTNEASESRRRKKIGLNFWTSGFL